MKINKKFTKAARRMLSVAVCLVMLFTTFFIFDPAVLSELFPKASAWSFTSYATSTNGDKAGLTINTSAKTVTVNTSNGFAYFLSHMTSEFQGYTVTLNTDVYMQPSQGATSVNYKYTDNNPTAWNGILDGNNHCISNYITDFRDDGSGNIYYFGIIRRMSGGEIKNITVLNSLVNAKRKRDYTLGYAGVLVGAITGSATVTFSNVTIDGSTVNIAGGDHNISKADRSEKVGGIVGYVEAKTSFNNCKVLNSKIQTNSWNKYSGGFVGYSTADITIQHNDQKCNCRGNSI